MIHSTSLPSSLNTALFYKAPVPLLIGNLPFGDDFKEKRHEYEYLDYYIVGGNTYSGDDAGFLFYNKFYNNYTILLRDCASWSCMYPTFYVNGANFCLNPFVNDINGACSWIPENSNYNDGTLGPVYHEYSDTIYYNFTENRYERGLGEDVDYYEDAYFDLPHMNFCNGYIEGSYDGLMHYSVADTYDDLRNWNLATPFSNKMISYRWQFEPDPTTSASFNVSNLMDPQNFQVDFYETVLSTPAKNYSNGYYATHKGQQLRKAPNYNRNTCPYVYDRLGFLKDLDHEDNPTEYEEICGVYENNQLSYLRSFILGSVVIGNEQHRDDLGWFIGISNIVTNYKTPFGWASSTNWDNYRIQTTNVIPISKKRENNVGLDYDWNTENKMNLANFDFIITLGYAWKSTNKRYLVYYLTNNKEGLYRRFRVFLVDKDPALLFSQRQIWYADLPVDDSGWSASSISLNAPQFFKHPFYYSSYGVGNFTELTFNYVNLDDETDIKSPVTFSMIGTCRENAQNELLGFPIRAQYKEQRFFRDYYKTNVYIGYWDTPIVNFEEEENK